MSDIEISRQLTQSKVEHRARFEREEPPLSSIW
jgi:hypothetical protein